MVCTRAWLLFALEPIGSDLPNYFTKAARALDTGRVPYRDFVIEYPPPAYWLMLLPRWVQSERLTGMTTQDEVRTQVAQYRGLFRAQMAVLDGLAFVLFLAVTRRRRPDDWGELGCAYVVITAVLGHLLYDRLDTALLFLLLAWAFAWLRYGEGGPRAATWGRVSYLTLGFAIAFKLVPVIVVPVILAAEMGQRTHRLRPLESAALLALGVALPFALQYPTSGLAPLTFVDYHLKRGIQVESTFASLLMLIAPLGFPIKPELNYGAWHLSGALTGLMRTATTISTLALVLGLTLWAYSRRGRDAPLAAFRAGALAIVGSLAVSKVLSPQYFIFALPFLLILASDLIPSRAALRVSLFTAILVAVLTTWLFPYHYYAALMPNLVSTAPASEFLIPSLSPVPCVVLGVRNLLYVALVTWLGIRLFKQASVGRTARG